MRKIYHHLQKYNNLQLKYLKKKVIKKVIHWKSFM